MSADPPTAGTRDTLGAAWPPGPQAPRLAGEAAVELWLADLADAPESLVELLSEQELTRAARFPGTRRGALWARGRGILRELLGRYLSRDPRDLRLEAQAGGRPWLAEGSRRAPAAAPCASQSELSFSLSHSGRLAIYAFARAPVGVDIELVGRPRDEVALAIRAFGPAEAARLASLEPKERQREFLRSWVRLEARLKRRGTGFAGDWREADPPADWVTDLEVGRQAVAALACRQPPRDLGRWSWRCW